MRDVVDSIAARQKVPEDYKDQVHTVREYRNALVHERDDDVEIVAVTAARGYLCRFLSYLPDAWK